MLLRRTFLTVFCALRKVRFQCYSAKLKFNQIVLLLKLLPTTIYIIVQKFGLDTFCGSLYKEDSNACSKAFSHNF